MKIEFLDDLTAGGLFPHADPTQLVRLYDFDRFQATRLQETIKKFIHENNKGIDLKSLDFIQVINCDLSLRISETDKGITIHEEERFICDLTIKGYEKMLFLIAPFCKKDINGYQWLYELNNPIDFLFSSSGSW